MAAGGPRPRPPHWCPSPARHQKAAKQVWPAVLHHLKLCCCNPAPHLSGKRLHKSSACETGARAKLHGLDNYNPMLGVAVNGAGACLPKPHGLPANKKRARSLPTISTHTRRRMRTSPLNLQPAAEGSAARRRSFCWLYEADHVAIRRPQRCNLHVREGNKHARLCDKAKLHQAQSSSPRYRHPANRRRAFADRARPAILAHLGLRGVLHRPIHACPQLQQPRECVLQVGHCEAEDGAVPCAAVGLPAGSGSDGG